MQNKPEKHNLYGAANLLSSNCHKHFFCSECSFWSYDNERCLLLANYPKDWPAFKTSLWSDADITLAKALRMMGYTQIVRGTNNSGKQVVQAQRVAPGILEIENLPLDSFLGAEEGIYYDLERIQ